MARSSGSHLILMLAEQTKKWLAQRDWEALVEWVPSALPLLVGLCRSFSRSYKNWRPVMPDRSPSSWIDPLLMAGREGSLSAHIGETLSQALSTTVYLEQLLTFQADHFKTLALLLSQQQESVGTLRRLLEEIGAASRK